YSSPDTPFFSFHFSGHHPILHSFPTRRSSDLNFFQSNQRNLPRGGHNQHQFGGTIGGPIKRNKTYFFFSFEGWREVLPIPTTTTDRKSTRLNSSHSQISYAVFCLKKKKKKQT